LFSLIPSLYTFVSSITVGVAGSLFSFGIYNRFFQLDDMYMLKYVLSFLQDWFAFLGNGSEFNFTLIGEAFFPNTRHPTAEENYGFCQVSVFD